MARKIFRGSQLSSLVRVFNIVNDMPLMIGAGSVDPDDELWQHLPWPNLTPEEDARLTALLDGTASDYTPTPSPAAPDSNEHSTDPHVSMLPATYHRLSRRPSIEALYAQVYGHDAAAERNRSREPPTHVSPPNTIVDDTQPQGAQQSGTTVGSSPTLSPPPYAPMPSIETRQDEHRDPLNIGGNVIPIFSFTPSINVCYIMINGILCGYFDGEVYHSLMHLYNPSL